MLILWWTNIRRSIFVRNIFQPEILGFNVLIFCKFCQLKTDKELQHTFVVL
jgi:hypothetical protein